jgi:hypothetical protein
MRYVLILLMACGVARGDMRRVLLGMRDARTATSVELWTPADITSATVYAWYDASELSGSGTITNWPDKIGNKHLQQSNNNYLPTITNYNSKTALFFDAGDVDGNGDTLKAVNWSNLSQPYSGHTAIKFLTDPASNADVWGSESPVINVRPNWSGVAGGVGLYYAGQTALRSARLFAGELLLDVYFSGTSSSVSTNATLIEVDNAGTLALGTLEISRGIGGNAEGDLNAIYMEHLIVSGTLSSDETKKLQGYLAHKWGLTANLPSDHPWKSNPPTK